jgi:hypothetical protein
VDDQSWDGCRPVFSSRGGCVRPVYFFPFSVFLFPSPTILVYLDTLFPVALLCRLAL